MNIPFFRKIARRNNSKGFLLPTVIILAVAIGTVSVVGLQSITTSSTALNDQYYETLAKEAAQAGIASAGSCAKKGLAEAWSNSTPLKPSTGCDGSRDGTKLDYIAKLDNWESSYSVKAIERAGPTSAVFTSIGTVSLTNNLGVVIKTYEQSAKTIAQITASTPTTGSVSKTVDSLAVGGVSACVSAEGSPYCWGFNGSGQLGNGTKDSTNTNKPVAVSKNLIQPVAATPGECKRTIVIAGIRACAVYVTAVGAQTGSALAGKTTSKVAMGTDYTCAIAEGAVYCWGDNRSGQLGDGTNESKLLPAAVYAGPGSPLAGKTVVDIQASDGFTCALTSDGKGACWGDNTYGQLGDNSRTSKNTPSALHDAAEVPATTRMPNPCGGFRIVFGIRINEPPCTPIPVPAIPAAPLYQKKLVKLAKATTSDHMCAISDTAVTYCWGRNEGGQIGDRMTHADDTKVDSTYTSTGKCSISSMVPVDRDIDAIMPKPIYTGSGSALQGKTVTSIEVANDRTNAIGSDGRIYAWGGGNNTTSEGPCKCTKGTPNATFETCEKTLTLKYNLKSTPLGPGYTGTTSSFCWSTMSICTRTTPLDNKQISMISTTSGAFCSVSGNTTYCDGPVYDNYQGQLGDEAIPVGYRTSANIFNTNSSVHKVYDGDFLRNKTLADLKAGYRSPTLDEVLGLFGFFGVNWSAAFRLSAESRSFTCALADGTVGCWGVNNAGQLGTGDYDSRNVPTAVAVDGPLSLPPNTSATFENPVDF